MGQRLGNLCYSPRKPYREPFPPVKKDHGPERGHIGNVVGGEPIDENYEALRWEAIEAVLCNESKESVALLPRRIYAIVVEYSPGFSWRFATAAPGLSGSVQLVGERRARLPVPSRPVRGTYDKVRGFVSGDTPMTAGCHAWRVTLDKLQLESATSGGYWVIFGIAAAGRQLREDSYMDPSFLGVNSRNRGERYASGWLTQDTGFDVIRSGDRIDLVLDCDAGQLTVITLKDGRMCTFTSLPRGVAWVPHFYMARPGNLIDVQMLRPRTDF